MKLVGYARVSTDKQAEASLPQQREAIEAWCKAMGHELVALHEDAASGRTTDRPGLQQAVEVIDQGDAVGLVTVYLDRLSRDVRSFWDFVDRIGGTLVCVRDYVDTTTAMGRMLTTQRIAVAQMERERIAERTVEALARKRAEGVRLGRAQLGRTQQGDWLSPAWEQAADVARGLRGEGNSWEQIAFSLGHRPDGKVWHWTAARSLLA